MSATFFEQLGIPEPDANLGVGSGTHATQTAEMLVGLERLMQEQQPDYVLVYGDTNSTLAGAMSAAKLHFPIAHVEAGLRSFNRSMPEEINRVVTDHLSQLLFCPTDVAVQHLANEGIIEGVIRTGDIMVDAVHYMLPRAHQESFIHEHLDLDAAHPYAVVTIHRPANADHEANLRSIMNELQSLKIPVIFPVHPRTRQSLDRFQIQAGQNVQLIDPLGYMDMLALVSSAKVLITDSGGLQKEAYVLETPCVTVRTETEWVETVESGWNRLTSPQTIGKAVQASMESQPPSHPDFYGDGSAAAQIVSVLESS